MATLVELTASIIASQAASTSMSSDELLKSIQLVHATLKSLEAGGTTAEGAPAATEAPTFTIRQAFKKDEVICMICGKRGLQTLKRHLSMVHNINPREYRKQFGIPASQSLVAKAFSERSRQAANDRGQGEILAKARAAKFNKVVVETVAPAHLVEEKPAWKTTARVPKVKTPAPVPAVRVKPPVPMKTKKAAVPMVIEKTSVKEDASVPVAKENNSAPAKLKAKVPSKTKKPITGKK